VRPDPRHEAGLTLVEVLLAIAILGIGVVVIVGGMMTSIKVSAQGRQSAESQTTLRGYAEAVAGASYVDCAVATSYSTTVIGYTAPTGYVPTLAVSYWTASGASGSFGGTCTADSGLQRLVLTVTAADGTTETLRTIKRRLT
jgi:prepilin-type N-terminal cleavage/methylation domain-containing protein